MKKRVKILLIFFLSLTLTGCWNYSEINDSVIVAGAAIDKAEDNQIRLTVELVEIDEYSLEQNFKSLIVEATGNGFMDTSRALIRTVAKKLYWGHATSIIISKEIAQEGISEILNWIIRDQEPSPAIEIYVSTEDTAAEILNTEGLSSSIKSFEIKITSDQIKDLLRFPILKSYQIVNGISKPYTHIALPTIKTTSIKEVKTPFLSGAAVFEHDKMKGVLSENDVRAYLFIKDEVTRGLITINDPSNGIDNGTFEILRTNTIVKPNYSGESLSFDVNIHSYVTIVELLTNSTFASVEGRNNLENIVAENMKNEIEGVINKVQKEYGLDIFGFGDIIYQRNPKLWKEISNDWSSIFKDLKVNVNVNIEIKNSGHLIKDIEVMK